MTRENPLTHHEKLRYDYLLKNIHYLNDKEKREFAFLTAHSILHLCGYDHENEEDARVMEEKQEKALNALSITRDTV